MKTFKTCTNCMIGTPIIVNNDIFCTRKGPVSNDFVCKKHKLQSPESSFNIKLFTCSECKYYIVDNSTENLQLTKGYCHLFTVRTFQGNSRKACSKFIKTSEIS